MMASSTGSGSGREVFHLIDYGWGSYWHSENSPGQWVQINFKEMTVRVDGYSLKSENEFPDLFWNSDAPVGTERSKAKLFLSNSH
jgi:hypothetical protein